MSAWQEHDLIVVGGGTAGMACAITAAEHGARLVVVEKTDDVGGTLHLSSGQLSAAGSRRQRAQRIDDSPDHHFDEVMRLGHDHADSTALLSRLAVDEAPHTIDWLEDLGFEFAPGTPALYHGHEPYTRPRTYWGPEGGRSVLRALSGRWAALAGPDGPISVLFGHRADALIREGEAVVGVEAAGPHGRIALHAPSHGPRPPAAYAANHALFAAHTPRTRAPRP